MVFLRKQGSLFVGRGIVDSVSNALVVEDRDPVDEIVHVDCCQFSIAPTAACKPIRDVLVRDTVRNDCINRVLVRANSVYSLEHFGDLFRITIDHVVHVPGLFSLKAMHRQPLLFYGITLRLEQLLQRLVRRLQLVVVKEAHQMPLPWLQSDLTGEGADSELLDDLEDVDFAMKLRKCVFLKKFFSFWSLFTTTEIPAVAQVKEIAAPVPVREDLPLGDGLL